MLKLSPEEELQIVSFYKTLIDERVKSNATLTTQIIPEMWERHLGTYSSKKNKNFPWKGSSDVHVPWAAFADTALESRFVAGVHSSDKLVAIDGLSNSSKEGGRKVTKTFNYKLAKVMNLYNVICDLFQGLIVEGTRFLEIYPIETEKTVWRYEGIRKLVGGVSKFLGFDIDKSTNRLISKKKPVKFWMPKWDDISVRDLVWEKGATSIQDAQWVARWLHLNTYQIKKKKNWVNLDKLPADIKKSKNDETETVINEHIGDMDAQMHLDFNNVSIWKVWGAYPFKTGKQDEQGRDIVEERECQFVLDIKNNIYLHGEESKLSDKRKPLVSIPCYRIAGHIRGQGLPQRLSMMNDELDATHNVTIDNAILCNAITIMYVPSKGFKPTKTVIRPGATIKVNNLEGVMKVLELGHANLDLHKLEGFIVTLLEKLGMITDYSMGREQVQRPTVRGTMALLREFNVNVNFLLKNIQEGLTEAVRMTLLTLYEFMPSDGIPFIGEDGKEDKLTRDDLEDIDDMTVTVLAEAIRAIKNTAIEKAAILFDNLSKDESLEINTAEVKKNLVEEVDHKMVEKIIRDPKEIQEIQQAQQQIMQKIQELKERERELVIKEGMAGAEDYKKELEKAGVPKEEIEKKLVKYRESYIEANAEPEGGEK